MTNNKYVVQVRTDKGWATITNRATRANAHRVAAKINGRVFNLWTRRPSNP
jgi:hypothetical protein